MKYKIPVIQIDKCNHQSVFPPMVRKGWLGIFNKNAVKYEYFKVLEKLQDEMAYILERKTPSYYWQNFSIEK